MVQTLFVFVCLCRLPASAQISGGSFGGAGDKHYKVSGTVVNLVTSEPVPHALVQFYSQSVLTDSGGHFEFADLPEITAVFLVRKPGFFSEQELTRTRQTQDMVHIGPDTPPVTLKLVPEAVVYGKIESGGEPVERTPVTLFQSTINNGRRIWQQQQTFADENGEFRIAGLRPGTYLMSAGPSLDTSSLIITGPDLDVGYAKTFYSGALELDQATPINVAAGQQVEIDFSLKKAHAFKLSGTIVGKAPGSNASVMFQDGSGRVFGFPVRFDVTGQQFSLWAPSGSYVIRADSQDQNGKALMAELPITVNSDRSGIVLSLRPMPSIPVVVHMESSPTENSEKQRLARFSFSFGARNSVPASVMLETSGSALNPRSYSAFQEQGSNSQFSFRNIEPGKYNLVVRPYGPWYVQSATSGGANLLNQPLEVGGGGQSIDIVLRNDSATLNVALGTERRTSGAILVIRDDALSDIKAMSIDSNGPFPVIGLAPGGYNVLAFDQIDELEYSNPEVLGRYLSRATHVNLEADQTVDVSVERIQLNR